MWGKNQHDVSPSLLPSSHLQPKVPHFGTQLPENGGELLAEGGASRRAAQVQEIEGGSGHAEPEETLGGVHRRLPLVAL